jgi:hypothetical protein
MFNLFFRFDPQLKKYVYIEDGIQYEMSLLLMLKFKKHYRKQRGFPGNLPIAAWLFTLSKEELQDVTKSLSTGKVKEIEVGCSL